MECANAGGLADAFPEGTDAVGLTQLLQHDGSEGDERALNGDMLVRQDYDSKISQSSK